MPCDARWSCSQRLNYSTKLQSWISPLFTKQQGYLYQMKADASDVLCIREKSVFNMSVIKQVPVTVLVCSNKDYTWNNSCNGSNQLNDFKLFHCHFPRSSVFCIGQPGKWNGHERNHSPLPPSYRSSERSHFFVSPRNPHGPHWQGKGFGELHVGLHIFIIFTPQASLSEDSAADEILISSHLLRKWENKTKWIHRAIETNVK